MPPKQPKVRAPNRDSAVHRYETESGRKVWDHWGPKACYNRSKKIRPDELHCHAPCRRAYKPRPHNKTNPWFMALKEFNKDTVTWCIPKRGTGRQPLPDYKKVMRMKDTIEAHQAKQRMAAETRRRQEEEEDDLPLSSFARKPNRPDAIPKKGQTRQQANEQRAENERMAKRRADDAAHTAAAEKSAREEAARRKRLLDNAVERRKNPPRLTKKQQQERQSMKASVASRKQR